MGFNCITSDLPLSGSWLRSIPRKPSFRTNPLGSLFLDCDPIAKSVTARILSEAGSFAGRVAVAHSQTSRPNMFYEPRDVYRGRDEIDRVAGTIKATHPDFRYQPIAGAAEELGNGGRSQWVSGRPVRRQLALGLISSLPGTAGLPPFIFFSTSYPEPDCAVPGATPMCLSQLARG